MAIPSFFSTPSSTFPDYEKASMAFSDQWLKTLNSEQQKVIKELFEGIEDDAEIIQSMTELEQMVKTYDFKNQHQYKIVLTKSEALRFQLFDKERKFLQKQGIFITPVIDYSQIPVLNTVDEIAKKWQQEMTSFLWIPEE